VYTQRPYEQVVERPKRPVYEITGYEYDAGATYTRYLGGAGTSVTVSGTPSQTVAQQVGTSAGYATPIRRQAATLSVYQPSRLPANTGLYPFGSFNSSSFLPPATYASPGYIAPGYQPTTSSLYVPGASSLYVPGSGSRLTNASFLNPIPLNEAIIEAAAVAPKGSDVGVDEVQYIEPKSSEAGSFAPQYKTETSYNKIFVPVPVQVPYAVTVTKDVPVPVRVPLPVQVTKDVPVQYRVPVPVDTPYSVPRPVPFTTRVPAPYDVVVSQTVPVPVPVQVRVPVSIRNPRPVPLCRFKMCLWTFQSLIPSHNQWTW